MTDEQYEQVLDSVPEEIKKKFLVPLAGTDPVVHNHIMSFIYTLQDKGYVIAKAPNPQSKG